MAANSLPRRFAKKLLAPLMNEKNYRVLQAMTMAWDIRSGNWHDAEMELIDKLVQPGDTVLDIGANYGLYSYHLSKAVGPAGKVYAFEPLPFTADTFDLVASLMRFKQVELIRKGAGEKQETVEFTVPIQENGAIAAGLTHMGRRNNERDGKNSHFQFNNTKKVTCEVVAIDEHLPNLDKVSFIKSDIEGADLYALKGARKTIERNLPSIFCEVEPWYMRGFNITVEDLVDNFLSPLGYEAYGYQDGKLRPASTQLMKAKEKDRGWNWFFIHPSRQNRVSQLIDKAAFH